MAIFKEGRTGQSDRSQYDRKRHRELVEDAIKRNMGEIIADESIIGQSKNKKIKIPIRGIKEYQFIYGKNNGGTASGTGKEQRGQVIGRSNNQQEKGMGPAGSEQGEDIYEIEITMDEIIKYMFEDIKLPDLERKKYALQESEYKFKKAGYQRKGIPPRLAKKRTMVEKLKRQQGLIREKVYPEADFHDGPQERERVPFREDDLRYFRVKEDIRRHSNAVVFCIMDVSGSMDQSKKYLARSFYFLLYQFLRWKYEHVEVVFIAHTTEAKEVDEREFFHHGESGGTMISSGYAKALEIIEQRYSPTVWNIYCFHCTDGDNWTEDNPRTIERAKELVNVSNLFGYVEILANYGYGVTVRRELEQKVKDENFIIVSMGCKDDIWPTFKQVLEKEKETGSEIGGEI
jgi:sporulation protein YhbH